MRTWTSVADFVQEVALARIEGYQEAFSWLRRPDLVSIAVVQGHAIGAGFQLALSCDLRVVADDAKFSMAEVKLGLVPDLGGTKPLCELIGPSRALDLCVTGRRVSAEEAERIGLVAEVLEDDHLMERALEAAEQIAAWAPWGVRLTKQGMWASLEIPSEQAAVEYEDRQQIMAIHGRATGEAVSAFLEKRPAQFAD